MQTRMTQRVPFHDTNRGLPVPGHCCSENGLESRTLRTLRPELQGVAGGQYTRNVPGRQP
jgi:hypothetical protein